MTLYLDAQSEKYSSVICYGLFDSCRDDFNQENYRVISLPEFFEIMTSPEVRFTGLDFTSAPFSPFREFSRQVAKNLHMKNEKIPFIAQNSYFTKEAFVFIPGVNPQIYLINDSTLFPYMKKHQEELLIADMRDIQPLLKLGRNLVFNVKELDPIIKKCIFGEKDGLVEVIEQWGVDTIKLSLCNTDYINHIEGPFLRHNLFYKILGKTIILKAATDFPNWTRGIKRLD